ncbi:MAG TPA: hypothetical protein VM597_00800 [Gemmataceae bacterium]|nr:hypothetical protein [Gemmataceae bacterium]
MPATAKPLFRPETLHQKLAAFSVPPAAAAGRAKLGRWADLVEGPGGLALKETELLPEFLGDVFRDLLGYTTPAGGGPTYTLKRESLVKVDGKFADAALGRFATADGAGPVVVAVEGKGPADPLDRPFKTRKKSAVDQALGYAVNFPCDWYLVTTSGKSASTTRGTTSSPTSGSRPPGWPRTTFRSAGSFTCSGPTGSPPPPARPTSTSCSRRPARAARS